MTVKAIDKTLRGFTKIQNGAYGPYRSSALSVAVSRKIITGVHRATGVLPELIQADGVILKYDFINVEVDDDGAILVLDAMNNDRTFAVSEPVARCIKNVVDLLEKVEASKSRRSDFWSESTKGKVHLAVWGNEGYIPLCRPGGVNTYDKFNLSDTWKRVNCKHCLKQK